MDQQDPFVSPRSEGASDQSPDDTPVVEVVDESQPWPWRWGDYLLLPDQCALPELCVCCGVPSDRPLRPAKVKWFHPALFAFMPLTIPIMLVGQKNGCVFYTLCVEHDDRRSSAVRVAWGLGVLAAALFLLGAALTMMLREGWPMYIMILAFFMLLIAVAIPALMPGVLRIHRIEQGVVWLRLLPPQFLEGRPQLPSADGRRPIIPPFELWDE